jgi:hypothetical protein
MTEYERFGLVFTKTRVYKFGHRKSFYLDCIWRGPPPPNKKITISVDDLLTGLQQQMEKLKIKYN